MGQSRVVRVAVLAAVVALSAIIEGCQRSGSVTLSTPYQAVLLSNGQAFFGKLENAASAFPVLTDVHYVQVQVNPQTKQQTNLLVRRGKEWHAPDRTVLNGRHIVLIEPVAEGSEVAKLIAELRKQQ
jgi:hypothetical protein